MGAIATLAKAGATALTSTTGLKVLSIASLALNVGGKIASGIAAKNAAEEEAERLEDQGELARLENEAEAERVGKEREKFIARQKLAFLKGGVTLEGSPLIILEESEEEAEKEVQAIIERGFALESFAQQQAASVSSAGTARLFGSLGSAIGSGLGGIAIGQKIGLF